MLIILCVPELALLHYLAVEQSEYKALLSLLIPNLFENAKEPKTVAYSVLLV